MPMAAVGTPTTPVGGPATVPTSGNTPSANANNATSAPITAKTWELSDYELQRTPQEAITDDTEIAISPRALHSELMCPICLDMLHQTMTTKECLHRFCCECIVTALRSGNKECPTCRKKLVSKRSLRPDPNFDELIANIYPSRDEYEAQQQKALANLSKSHNQLALATSIEVGMKAQSQVRKIQKANPKSNVEGTESLASAAQLQTGDQPVVSGSQNPSEDVAPNIRPGNAAGVPAQTSVSGNKNGTALPQNATTSAGAMKSSNVVVAESNSDNTSNASGSGMTDEISEIELVFKPHPDMQVGTTGTPPVGLPTEHIQTRFIKTSGNATVEHLRKYLGMRLALDSDSGENEEGPLRNCSIWISPTQGNYMKVPVGLTLGQVCDKYWKLNKPLEVYYFWKKI